MCSQRGLDVLNQNPTQCEEEQQQQGVETVCVKEMSLPSRNDSGACLNIAKEAETTTVSLTLFTVLLSVCFIRRFLSFVQTAGIALLIFRSVLHIEISSTGIMWSLFLNFKQAVFNNALWPFYSRSQGCKEFVHHAQTLLYPNAPEKYFSFTVFISNDYNAVKWQSAQDKSMACFSFLPKVCRRPRGSIFQGVKELSKIQTRMLRADVMFCSVKTIILYIAYVGA